MLQHIDIKEHNLQNGKKVNISLSYQIFGKPIGNSPIILVNHALTGNSEVAGKNGWWNQLIESHKSIDLEQFTLLSFNIPGNGFDDFLIENYTDFTLKDIASIFLEGLNALNINSLFAIIGGSLGGAIAWEMAFQNPKITELLIPIATDYKVTDWIIGHCRVQELILTNSKNPVQDARAHAMLFYRSPESLNKRFDNQKITDQKFSIEDWLEYHGNALNQRFSVKSYLLMNHLLKTIHVCDNAKDLQKIESEIHIVSVDSDKYFTHERTQNTYNQLFPHKKNCHLHIIQSIHGHDAFLIEYRQLNQIIQQIFQTKLVSKL